MGIKAREPGCTSIMVRIYIWRPIQILEKEHYVVYMWVH